MQFGIPKMVTSDQGSEFNNNLDRKLMKLLNVDHRLTSPYHPQVSIYYISTVPHYNSYNINMTGFVSSAHINIRE